MFGGRLVFQTSMSRRQAIVVGAAIAAVTLALVGLIVATAPRRRPPETAAAYAAAGLRKPGTLAPAFDAPSLYRGRPPVRLSNFRGSTVVLSFFASWCPGCKEELPVLSRAAARHPAGVEFVGIDVNDDPRTIRPLLAKEGVRYPIGTDRGTIVGRFGVTNLPTSFLIGPDERIEQFHVEALTARVLARWLGRRAI